MDRLRTRVWLAAVKAISGLPTGYAVEVKLEPERVRRYKNRLQRSGKWEGYEQGERVPERRVGKVYAVDLAEAAYPGTARYFDSALWPILRCERVEVSWIDAQLYALTPDVVKVLFVGKPRRGEPVPRFRRFDFDIATQLSCIDDFDALVASVLLMVKAELTAAPELRRLARESYLELQPYLEKLPELRSVAKDLFQAIDLVCKHWVYLNPAERREMVVFTQDLRTSNERVCAHALREAEQLMRTMMRDEEQDAGPPADDPVDA